MAGRPGRRARQAKEDYERGIISKDEARREGVVFDDDPPESPVGDTSDIEWQYRPPARTTLEEVEAELRGEPFPDTILPFEHISNPKQRAFLIAYSECGSTRKAEVLSGVSRRNLTNWRHDPAFQEAYEDAEYMSGLTLEDEMVRRGVEGVDEPAGWYKGVAGGTVRKYSDTLLQTLAKARRPQKFREQIDVRAALSNIDFLKLPPEQLTRIAAGESILSVLGSALHKALPPGNEVGTQDD